MAVAKEIRSKIKSIQSTQKITRAMEMVAASKMRKAQERMRASRPYSEKIRQVIDHLARGNPEYQHPYLIHTAVKKAGLIVISSDRGLCGGLNINLFRHLLEEVNKLSANQVEVDYALVGTKAEGFFKRLQAPVLAHVAHIGDSPSITDLWGAVRVMLNEFEQGNIQELYVAYNRFENTMSQKAMVQKILPIQPQEQPSTGKLWDYIYEPDARTLLDQLLKRYLESQVYQAVVENIACEQAARMVAMKSASDNAGQIISELKLAYNKARQAAITQEISEIVGGAAAV